jgi:hypothetical protein
MANQIETKVIGMEASAVPFSSDGMDVPTLFVDDIRGVSVLGNVARLNLVEARVDPITSELKHRLVAVLAVPVDYVVNWGPFLARHFTLEAIQEAMAEANAEAAKKKSDA